MTKNVDIQQYIDAKNVAYKFYSYFSKLDNSLKVKFIDRIREEQDTSDFLKEVTITTLLFPNDYYLLTRGSNNNLVQDTDNILRDLCIDRELLNFKRREFQFMNFSELLSDGVFDVEFNKFPLNSDEIYQEYLVKKAEFIENEKKSK